MCENECHFVLGDTCLNQDRYSNNDEYEVAPILALKYGAVFKGDENEIFEQHYICI